jgi:hypothetical protein
MAGREHGDVERRSARWWVAAVAAGSFGIEMAVSARYGYDRDELYFLAAGHHPAMEHVELRPAVGGLPEDLGGKPYYPGAVYTFVFAAGSVPIGRWVAARTSRAGRAWPVAVILLSAAIGLPISLPVLPARALHTVPLQKINYDLAETISWPQQVALVGRLYGALPAPERARTTILTGNYGEAGAIERYGPQSGVPTAYSGANNFWLWGPPPAADTGAIAVDVDPGLLRREFTHVRQFATFWNGLGVGDDEQGVPVYLATGLKSSWARAWPAFRDYS